METKTVFVIRVFNPEDHRYVDYPSIPAYSTEEAGRSNLEWFQNREPKLLFQLVRRVYTDEVVA